MKTERRRGEEGRKRGRKALTSALAIAAGFEGTKPIPNAVILLALQSLQNIFPKWGHKVQIFDPTGTSSSTPPHLLYSMHH